MSPLFVSVMFFVAGLVGAACKACLSNDQATWSRKSIGDVVLGGVGGILLPTIVPLPVAWNMLQQAALIAGLTYSGVDVIQNVLQKLGLALPGGPGAT
jgi:hypothetical protein